LSDHHDGCFGCGQANLFGLQLESNRFFVKQDHQGPPGQAHGGILAAALQEAIELAAGDRVERIEVDLVAPAPVGTFVEIEVDGDRAVARVDGSVVARAFARVRPR
jgi:acyl-coenzyme A thioesterase PaaI-like protein